MRRAVAAAGGRRIFLISAQSSLAPSATRNFLTQLVGAELPAGYRRVAVYTEPGILELAVLVYARA